MDNKIRAFNDKIHPSKRSLRLPCLGLLFFLLMGIGSLYSTSWSGSKGYLNPVFEEYFQELAQFEWELLAGEVSSEIEERTGGSLTRLYELYTDALRDIQSSIEQEENLSPLEKRTLWVYAEHIVVNQAYSSYYTISFIIGSPETEEIKQVSIEGQDRIMSLIKNDKFPDDPVLEDRPEYQKRLRSFLLSLYAENFFFSITLRDYYGFAHESHTLYKEAFWYDPLNPRAYLGFGYFYTATANLSPLYAGIADRNYDYLLEHLHNESAMGDPYNRVLVVNALVGKSQSAIIRGSYATARDYLDRAGEIAPNSGFLLYINSIYQKRRTMYNYSREDFFEDEKSQPPIDFYYTYSIEASDKFLYKNLFNFISRDILWTVFLNAGNSFYPASSLLLEEGLTISLDRWSIDVGAMQNPLFTEGVGAYTGFLGAQFRLTDLYMKLRTQYGVFYDYMLVDSTFQLDDHQAMEVTLDWGFFLYHSSRVRLEIKQHNKYRYSFGKGVHTWRSELDLPWTLFDHLWGEVYTLNGVAFAYSSDPTSILNQAEFFSLTPLSLERLKKRLELYETPLSGVMIIHHTLSYRFYPLILMDIYTAAKGLFIAPSFHYGTVFNNLGDINGDSPDTIEGSFSVLGNIGYRFPGDKTISLGAGWNDRDGVVLNLLMY